jgi:membrane-associated phospholipid phosphatase
MDRRTFISRTITENSRSWFQIRHIKYRKIKQHTLHLPILLIVLMLSFTPGIDARASDAVEMAGDVLVYLLPTTAAGMTIIHKDGKGALQFGESAALTLGATYGLKYTVDENRPNGDNHSFPSAHASISFSSAEFVRKRYGWEYGVPAYVAATFVAYSRVESREHYPHDVIAGAIIGIVSSYIFTTPFNGWQILPETGSKYWGVRVSYRW